MCKLTCIHICKNTLAISDNVPNDLLSHVKTLVSTSQHVRRWKSKHTRSVQKALDLDYCDFFLFPKLKRPLKGRFETIPEIKANATKDLKDIQKKCI